MKRSAITREEKARRISVIINTTKGKKERMALAANEKANVCTSVRRRYLTVETIRLGGWRRDGRRRLAGIAALGGGTGVIGAGTGIFIVSDPGRGAGKGERQCWRGNKQAIS